MDDVPHHVSVLTTTVYDAANQIQHSEAAAGRTTYAYDANGNQLTKEEPSGDLTTNTWDFENKITQVELPVGYPVTFTYDGDLQRVEKDDGTDITRFVHDGENVLLETDDLDVTQVVYSFAPQQHGNLVSRYDETAMAADYYHFDALGSTDSLTDSSEVISDTYTYFAFGEIKASSGVTDQPFQWVGEVGYYFDSELSRHHVRARDYEPQEARWMSTDPIRSDEDKSIYAYVRNNPVNVSDPSGLKDPLSLISLKELHKVQQKRIGELFPDPKLSSEEEQHPSMKLLRLGRDISPDEFNKGARQFLMEKADVLRKELERNLRRLRKDRKILEGQVILSELTKVGGKLPRNSVFSLPINVRRLLLLSSDLEVAGNHSIAENVRRYALQQLEESQGLSGFDWLNQPRMQQIEKELANPSLVNRFAAKSFAVLKGVQSVANKYVEVREEIVDAMLIADQVNDPSRFFRDVPGATSYDPKLDPRRREAELIFDFAIWEVPFASATLQSSSTVPRITSSSKKLFGFGKESKRASSLSHVDDLKVASKNTGKASEEIVSGLQSVSGKAVDAELAAQQALTQLQGTIQHGHFLTRHSPLVKLSDLYRRATQGITPEGFQSFTNNSTRFLKFTDQQEAIAKASKAYQVAQTKGRARITIDMLKDVGEGYYKDTGVYGRTQKVVVGFNEYGQPVTAFPLLP